MNISTCQFSDSYFPIMDGVGMTAHNYSHWLNQKNGKSVLVAPKVKDYKDHVDYKVFRFKSVLLPGMNPYRLGLPMIDVKFKQTFRDMKFDLLHAHCPFVSGHLAQKMARKMNVPLVTTFHTKYRDDFRKVVNNDMIIDFMMNMTMDFYNAASLVWVPNKATGRTLQEYGYSGPFEVMPNGTDMEIPEKSQVMKYRKRGLSLIDADPDEFVMLFVGQHRWEKNVRLILESLRVLHANKKKFKMVFVGEGYASKEMKKLVKQYNLKDIVRFLGVITDRNELKSIYSASDLFIFPSLYDNSPLVIQEAAAFNIPSIVIKESSSAEEIIDGINGFTIENSSEALVKKVSELIKHQDIMKKVGDGARKSLHHPWENIVNDVYQRYTEIIKEHYPKHSRKSSERKE